MLDSFYHMPITLLKITFWCENIKILPSFTPYYNTSRYEIRKTLVVY